MQRLNALFPGITTLQNHIETAFAEENVFIVESVILFAFVDITMLQFMPWKKSKFYSLSHGYPSMALLKFCLIMKIADDIVSVTCESIYIRNHSLDTSKCTGYNHSIFTDSSAAFRVFFSCFESGILYDASRFSSTR